MSRRLRDSAAQWPDAKNPPIKVQLFQWHIQPGKGGFIADVLEVHGQREQFTNSNSLESSSKTMHLQVDINDTADTSDTKR